MQNRCKRSSQSNVYLAWDPELPPLIPYPICTGYDIPCVDLGPAVKSKQHNTGPKRERYLGGCLFRGDLQGGGSDGSWGGEAEGRSGTQAVS